VLPKGFVKVRYFGFFAAWLQLVSMQERSTQTALLPRFSLVLVGFLDIQSIQMSMQESGFDLAVRLKFQIARCVS